MASTKKPQTQSSRTKKLDSSEELRLENERLKKVDELKTQFFSNVSHEFRTPLTLILWSLEASLSDDNRKLTKVHQKNFDMAYGNALRLEKLVGDLLDFARMESGRNVAVYRSTNLAQLTYELSHHFESVARDLGIGYNVDCESLGEPVYVDRSFWEKIVLDLLSNAVKHTYEGSVSLQLKRDGDFAKLTIRDTGEGIPKKELSHVFEKFYTVKGEKTRSDEGSGIGLSLVQDLVKLHGGTISVESTVGKGTTLTVRIPFGTAHLPQKQISKSENSGTVSDHLHKAYIYEAARWVTDEGDKQSAAANGETAEATILVVDDNSDMRYYIKSILDQTKGWKTVLAPDGITALRMANEVKPDIILSDIMMPQMNGHELVKNLRADGDNKTTPVIFLSARAGEEAENTGMASGVDDYLVKPFTASELVARVNAHLKLSLTRKRVHEEEMQKLRELDEAKTQFLHQVSQLLSGPTSIVKQYTRVLIRDHTNNLTADQHHILEKIYESNEMNLAIVDTLLKDTQEGSGKGKL